MSETNINIRAKLSGLQAVLSVPKTRTNKFGGYKYWNCSDILSGVKKHFTEFGLSVLLSDEAVMIGDRFYIKATATLVDNDSTDTIGVSAYAREPQNVKGQSEAQISGASSSYARKYALCALLALDDEQDADATNTHGKDKPIATNANKQSEQDIF
jgi:hypothetical protein